MGDTPYYPYHPNGQGDQPEREGAAQDPVTGGYLPVDPAPYPAGAPVYPTYSGSYASPAAPPAAPVIEPPKHYEVPNYDALLSSRPRPTRRKRPEISSTQTAAPARPVLPDAAPTASRVHRRSAAERQSAQPVSVPTVATPSPAQTPVQTPGVNRPSPVVVDLRREEARPAAAVKPVAPPVVVEVKKVRKGSAVQPVVVPVPQTLRAEEPRQVEILTPPDVQGDARPQPEESAASALPVVEPALPQSPEPREASPRPEERPAVEPAPEAEAFTQQEEHGATAAATTFSAYSQSDEQDLSSLVEEFLSMNLKPASEPVTQPVSPAQTAAAEPVAPPALQPAPLEEPERPAPRVFDFAAPSPVPEAEPFEAPPLRPEPVRESEPVLVKRHDEERGRAGMPLFGIGFDAPMDAPIEPIVIEPVIPAPVEETPPVKAPPEQEEPPVISRVEEERKAPQNEPAPVAQAEVVTFAEEAPVPVSEGEPSFVFDSARSANGFETITFDGQPQAQPEAPPVEAEDVAAEPAEPVEIALDAVEETALPRDEEEIVETLPEPAPREDDMPSFAAFDAEPEFINFADLVQDAPPQGAVFSEITEFLDDNGEVREVLEAPEQPAMTDEPLAPDAFSSFEAMTESAQNAQDLSALPQADETAEPEPPFLEGFGGPVTFESFEDALAPVQESPQDEAEEPGEIEPEQPVMPELQTEEAPPVFGLFSDEAPALEPMPEPAFGAFGNFESEVDGPAEEPAQLEIPGALNGLSDFDMTVDSEPETEKFGGFGSFEEPSGEGEADEAEFGGFGSFGAFELPQEADEPTAEFGGFGSFAQQDAALHVNEPTEEFNGFGGARAAEEPAAEPGLSGNLFDTAFIPPAGNAGLSDIDDIANNLDQAMLAKTYNQAFTDNNLLADSGRAGLTVRGLNSEYFVSKHGATPGAMFENVGFTVNDGACLAIVSDIPLASYTLARAVAECFDDGEEEQVSVSDAQTGEEREILYVGSDEMIPDEMTCIEFLLYSLSAVYGETHEEREERVRVALSQVGMGDLEEEPLADLSHNKRLLILGLSAALNPNIGCVIFNDSRFNIEGVEENMARRVFALLASSGKSVVLSCCSRYLMATVANRVLVLKGGQAVFDSSYQEFIDSNCPGILSFTSRNPQNAMAYLQERFPDISALNKGNLIYLVRNDSREVDIEQLLKAVADSGADYNSVVIDDKSFDAALREVLGA